jgi:phage baseplate assembly protein W
MRDTLTGIAFPLRIIGGVVRSSDNAKIADDLRHLLSTRLGERTMLRVYGGGVHHRLQEANDSTLRALVKHEIEQGLRAFMPEVELVAPMQIRANGEEMTIAITYRADPLDVVRRLEINVP